MPGCLRHRLHRTRTTEHAEWVHVGCAYPTHSSRDTASILFSCKHWLTRDTLEICRQTRLQSGVQGDKMPCSHTHAISPQPITPRGCDVCIQALAQVLPGQDACMLHPHTEVGMWLFSVGVWPLLPFAIPVQTQHREMLLTLKHQTQCWPVPQHSCMKQNHRWV